MKKLIFICAVIVLSGVTFQSFAKTTDDKCKAVSDDARYAMKYRQAGFTVVEALRVTDKYDKSVQNTWKSYVLTAYKEPLEQSDKGKEMAVDEFQNFIYLACINEKQEPKVSVKKAP